MKHTYLLTPDSHDTTSPGFVVRKDESVFVAAFNLKPLMYEKNPDGSLKKDTVDSCDYIMFERILYDFEYGLTACKGTVTVHEKGIIASAPLRDDCSNIIAMTSCKDTLWITDPGLYRAVFVGNNRHGVSLVTYYNGA